MQRDARSDRQMQQYSVGRQAKSNGKTVSVAVTITDVRRLLGFSPPIASWTGCRHNVVGLGCFRNLQKCGLYQTPTSLPRWTTTTWIPYKVRFIILIPASTIMLESFHGCHAV